MKSVWEIEKDLDYIAWFKAIWDASPLPIADGRGKLGPGQKAIGRSLVIVEEKEPFIGDDGILHLGKLNVGVRLNTGEEFWKLFDGNFEEMVYDQFRDGRVFSYDYTSHSLFEYTPLLKEHGKVKRLEFASSHIGDGVWAIFEDKFRATVHDF